ncbi:hypothetical protein ABK040_009836 [Willaertia magna]
MVIIGDKTKHKNIPNEDGSNQCVCCLRYNLHYSKNYTINEQNVSLYREAFGVEVPLGICCNSCYNKQYRYFKQIGKKKKKTSNTSTATTTVTTHLNLTTTTNDVVEGEEDDTFSPIIDSENSNELILTSLTKEEKNILVQYSPTTLNLMRKQLWLEALASSSVEVYVVYQGYDESVLYCTKLLIQKDINYDNLMFVLLNRMKEKSICNNFGFLMTTINFVKLKCTDRLSTVLYLDLDQYVLNHRPLENNDVIVAFVN